MPDGWEPHDVRSDDIAATFHTEDRGVVLMAEGWLHVSGGLVAGEPAAACELYKPETKQWYEMPALPEPRRGHAAAAARGRVFVIGGTTREPDGRWPYSITALSWAPGETAWTELPRMPECAESFEAITLDNDDIVAWGDGNALLWNHRAWQVLGEIGGATALVAIAHGCLQLGGHSHGDAIATVRAWTPDGGWQDRAPLPAPRKCARAIRLRDGRVAVIGGMTTRKQWVDDGGSGGELDYEYRSFGFEETVNVATRELFIQTSAGWETRPAPALRECHVRLLADGRVLVRDKNVCAVWTP